MTLKDSIAWVKRVPESLPEEMQSMAARISESYLEVAARLMDLGLGYLTLDRASSTLSTGERQRMQLARAVRNRTTGVLYVLDGPFIGLHPANIVGLNGVLHDLVRDGNTVLLVDHDTQILQESDWLIEMGPGAGANDGKVIAEGTVADIEANKASVIGPYLSGKATASRKPERKPAFSDGVIHMETSAIHTVKPLVVESLVPALQAICHGERIPNHVKKIEAEGIHQVKRIDATPIGVNVRSTVATYANVHDELRKLFGRTADAKHLGYQAGDFSYNTESLRCPVCDGTGTISSMCNSFLMWTSPARNVMGRPMANRRTWSATPTRTASNARCRN